MSKFKDDFGMSKKKARQGVQEWLADFQKTGSAEEADQLAAQREAERKAAKDKK